jgi:hypothetical protein
MNEEQQADSAQVRIATGLSPAELVAFCQDAERLLRINSMYEFEEWQPEGEDRFFMHVHNLSNGQTLATPFSVEPRSDGLRSRMHRPAYRVPRRAAVRRQPAGQDRRGPSAVLHR